MPGLKEVRTRIASVKSTQQITNAMKMVAASKLRRAQSAILKLRPYAGKLREILQNLSASIDQTEGNIYSADRKPVKILMVVIASNRGLCGAFNSNIVKMATGRIANEYREQHAAGNVALLTIGRKATEYFRKRKFNVAESHDELFDRLTFAHVSELAEKLMKGFANQEYDRIELIYNQFKNAAVQRLIVEQYLPIAPQENSPESAAGSRQSGEIKQETDYIFEPDKETIVRELIPKTLRIQLFKAVLDSFASEQGARMTAMQKATENAKDLLRDLNISYNKARQNAITNAILEIVSGAEALKG
ncbi:MAG TPA: ATP synthase F1 subunit gamma [Bacteroidales bacterium]|nr:ATP synthase F1 subunit gamma [Bacteroidales bacterium]HPS61432.1 ATP synthase F1 subunit gamma [Bacteroidales bacterium]